MIKEALAHFDPQTAQYHTPDDIRRSRDALVYEPSKAKLANIRSLLKFAELRGRLLLTARANSDIPRPTESDLEVFRG
jgi:hypothetical protein